MARLIHPLTGVELNPIPIERIALNFEEAVTACLMRLQRVKYQTIAWRLGTNTYRLGEVFTGKIHPTAMEADRSRLYR